MTVAQRSRAAATIASKGQAVTIVGGTPGTYNPATGTTTPTSYSKTAHAVILPLGTPGTSWGNKLQKVGNTSIKEGDESMLLAGVDTTGAVLPEPPVDSVVTLANGAKRTLIAIDRLDPDSGGSIIFDCVIRGNA